MSEILLPSLIALATAWLLTGAVRRYALARQVFDIPNERSSHTNPTPRGGGLAIASVSLVAIAIAAGVGLLEREVAFALIGGGLMIAAIGWIDDHGEVSALRRISVHLLAAIWAVAWIGGLPGIDLGPTRLALGPAGIVLGVMGVVWFTNLFNFMDGIDGLAGGEAVVCGLAGSALLLVAGDPALAFVAAVIACASAGFLAWNWSPARIFMGDVGSGLLGFLFAVLAVASENRGAVPLLAWALLFGVFVFDATATLVRRVLRRERWYAAHRAHAYQRLVRSGWTHAQVTGAILAIDAVLALLALGGLRWPSFLPLGLAIGFGLVGLGYLFVERRNAM